MRKLVCLAALCSVLTWQVPRTARACGGFFCSRVPVDQSAERVVFTVHADGTTDMVVQITYEGRDEDFAWVLPVAAVPDNRTTFPQAALNALDNGTAPLFQLHPDCQANIYFEADAAGAPTSASAGGAGSGGDVTVYVREEVGPYDVAVIGSDDADASIAWLESNGYNIAETMFPYIRLYTAEKMKFLALRLTADADAGDIVPFRMTLPGESPGIPLRLTTLAAEPEMGVLVWVFADQRFGPANAEEVEVDLDELRWEPWSWGQQNNWAALVAREVDRYGGLAWVAETASDTKDLVAQIETSPVSTEEMQMAQEALLDLIDKRPYMTRLYTRLAPEEMVYDPVFKRSDAADVDRVKQLPYVEELCGDLDPPPPVPCDYAACGAMGLCRNVMADDINGNPVEQAACACAPGATARTTFAPDGTVTVSCQDERLSFMNPGARTLRGETFPDACAGFDCGTHGTCVAMNLTPTCECDKGYVARGWLDASGRRRTVCMETLEAIPATFYNRRPLERPDELPAGVEIALPVPSGPPDVVVVDHGEPVAPTGPGSSSSGGCASVSAPTSVHGLWLALIGLAAALWVRRRT